jgi:predicted acyl esterase
MVAYLWLVRPVHSGTPERVVPGEIYEYVFTLPEMSNVFKAGHRIKLEIYSMEHSKDPDMLLHYHPHVCSSRTTLHNIYRDNQHQSHLLLPVILKQ